jgi:uncharacterized membrane protein
MPRIDNAIEIKAPREKVFAYIADIEAQPEWVKWTKTAEVTSLNTRGVGTTDAMLMQVGPRKEQVEGIVTEYQDGYYVTRRHTRGMSMEERLSVVPYADGSKVAMSIDYVPPMGAMGKMMDQLFMARLFDQLMKDSLAILKDRLESAR